MTIKHEEIGQGIKNTKEKQVRPVQKQTLVDMTKIGRANQLRGTNLPGLRINLGPHGSQLTLTTAPSPLVLGMYAIILGHGTKPTAVQVA